MRKYDGLKLERTRVVFFPLSWTVVHPITEDSPLWGLSHADMIRTEAEVMILMTGIDETFSQTVHARQMYNGEDLRFGARFADMIDNSQPGTLIIDHSQLDELVVDDTKRE